MLGDLLVPTHRSPGTRMSLARRKLTPSSLGLETSLPLASLCSSVPGVKQKRICSRTVSAAWCSTEAVPAVLGHPHAATATPKSPGDVGSLQPRSPLAWFNHWAMLP